MSEEKISQYAQNPGAPGGLAADRRRESTRPSALLAWMLLLTCVATFGALESWRDRQRARELDANRDQFNAALGQAQNEIRELRAKLDALGAKPMPATGKATPVAGRRVAAASIPGAARTSGRIIVVGPETPKPVTRPAEDPRWKQMQARLSEQEKEIANTREDLNQTRDRMEGKLSSTRDELTGSIARNHDELVLLEKRGERNYQEFSLTKSKQFQRVGSISLSLRKANTKRKSYDLAMIVDDNELQKKNVNLYEPVLITLNDRPQPLELVVNKIGENEISGYLSEPKYKKSELAAANVNAGNTPAPGLQTRKD